MLNHLAVLQAEHVDGDHWLRPPTNVTAVNHYQIAFGDRHTWLVRKVFRQFWDQILYRSRTTRDRGVMLDIVRREVFVDDSWIPVNECSGQCTKGNLLVGFDEGFLD
ncbi:hypothetical protein BCF11_0853 [Collimonas sp. PA-H2]|nr:hypothetical protein BCF11_0853 [Collimonas sp. PA-H2]